MRRLPTKNMHSSTAGCVQIDGTEIQSKLVSLELNEYVLTGVGSAWPGAARQRPMDWFVKSTPAALAA